MKDYTYRKFFFQSIIVCLSALISGLLLNLFSENSITWFYKERIWQQGELLSAEQSYNLLKNKEAIFLDVRYEDEYQGGHIPGAILIPTNASLDKKVQIVETIAKEQLIVVYCENNQWRSARNFAGFLIHFGFKRVLLFDGGLEEWNNAGFPVE